MSSRELLWARRCLRRTGERDRRRYARLPRHGFTLPANGVREWTHREGEETVQKDSVSGRLKVLTDFFRLCWLAIFGVGGGSLSILLGPFALRRYVWAGTGIVVMLALRALLWQTHRKMQQLGKELQRNCT